MTKITATNSKEIYYTLSALHQIFDSEEVEIWGGSSAEEERMLRQVIKALREAMFEVECYRLSQSWE
jgi:hypothetical protein